MAGVSSLLWLAFSTVIARSQVSPLGSGQLQDCTIKHCPVQCQCSRESESGIAIDCSNRQLSSIPLEFSECNWPRVHSINLSGNLIDDLGNVSIFINFPDLKSLFLYHNKIAVVHSQCFTGLSSLMMLSLDGNQISVIDESAFTPLRNLKRLLLHSNRITTLPRGVFAKLNNLTLLTLHLNQLTSVDDHSFDGLHSLQQLYLHANQIFQISGSPFQNLNSLYYLYLSNNRLSHITKAALKGLHSLTVLVLDNNHVEFIHHSAFTHLLNLKQLYMNNNKIRSISSSIFTPLANLQLLRMTNNLVTTIADNAFMQLNHVSTMYLSGNQIVEITEKTFSGLASLRELVLNDNNFTTLPGYAFTSSPFLQRLWMSRCKVECISEHAFNGLSYLDLLQLSYNRISYLPNNIFQPTPSLRYIVLSSNLLANISTRPFRNLTKLFLLSLQFNSIQKFAHGSLEGSKLSFLQWNEGSSFSGDNALICDCWSVWLREWLMATDHSHSSVKCASPAHLRGLDIRDADFGQDCSNFSSFQVHIKPEEEVIYVTPGQCLLLQCSSSHPSDNIAWTRLDGEMREALPPYDKSCQLSEDKCGNVKHTEGLLVLSRIQPSDAGYYMCQATVGNTTTKKICRIKMGSPPVINVNPQNQRHRDPGVTVVFNVSVSGEPHPTITWSHGNHTLVFFSDSRFHKTEMGSLIIVNAQKADSGYYRVVAENSAGRVEAQAHLFIYAESLCYWGKCVNGGVCVASYYCHCPAGFTGSSCEQKEVTDSSDYGTSGDSDDDDEDRSALVTKRDVTSNYHHLSPATQTWNQHIISSTLRTSSQNTNSQHTQTDTSEHNPFIIKHEKELVPDWTDHLIDTTSDSAEMSLPLAPNGLNNNHYPTDTQLRKCC